MTKTQNLYYPAYQTLDNWRNWTVSREPASLEYALDEAKREADAGCQYGVVKVTIQNIEMKQDKPNELPYQPAVHYIIADNHDDVPDGVTPGTAPIIEEGQPIRYPIFKK